MPASMRPWPRPLALARRKPAGYGPRPLCLIFLCTYQKVRYIVLFNPRRACAARVTVVVLSVRLSVCLSVCPDEISDYRLRGGL